MIKVLMIVPNPLVKGGIASVVNGYRGSALEKKNKITYIESYRDGTKWQKFVKACNAYLEFHRAVRRERPDIVHIHSSFGPSFYRKMPFILWSARMGIPIINHIHGAEFDTFYEKASARKQKLVRNIYNKCNQLIVLSEEWKERMKQIVPEEKIEIIENYCKIPETIIWEKKNPTQVLFLGELGQRKGCYDIPDILEQAIRKVPPLSLIMAGDGEMNQVKQAFEEKHLLERVIFPGWVRGEQKEQLLRESAIFLFPSYHEGMPMAVLEAMSYGLGIVTTEVGGIPRLIQDGKTGFCKKAGDVNALAEALECLLTKENVRKDMGLAARRIAEEHYGLANHLQRLQQLYEKVCVDKNE